MNSRKTNIIFLSIAEAVLLLMLLWNYHVHRNLSYPDGAPSKSWWVTGGILFMIAATTFLLVKAVKSTKENNDSDLGMLLYQLGYASCKNGLQQTNTDEQTCVQAGLNNARVVADLTDAQKECALKTLNDNSDLYHATLNGDMTSYQKLKQLLANCA